jgi:outer membrane biosynthesis protein TonB
MAEQNTHINYSVEDIERYLKGKMSAKEMHEMEKAALQDPFLADAIEGFGNTSFEESHKHRDEITAALQTKKDETKVVLLSPKSFYWWRVAATIILVAGIGGASWYIIGSNNAANKNEIAQVQENKSKASDTVVNTELKNETVKRDSAKTLLAQNRTPRSLQKQKKKSDHVKKQEEVTTYALTKTQPSEQKTPNPIVADSFVPENKDARANISSLSAPLTSDTLRLPETDKKTLSKVAVTVYAAKKQAQRNLADSTYPSGGWKLFREYVYKKSGKALDTSNGDEIAGNVQIEFSIDENGVPYNFTVLKSLNDETASTVIEIIREGPRWITTSKNKKGRVTIQF